MKDILEDLFKGYDLLNKLKKVSKLTEAGIKAQDPRFKALWLRKATQLSKKSTEECKNLNVNLENLFHEDKNLTH
tara:strand:- start:38 stop:262 length:225 start_codon:yes stop_codon:yes gene_type:complete